MQMKTNKPHENNYVISSQQWPRGHFTAGSKDLLNMQSQQRSDRHLDGIKKGENQSKLLVTDINNSMVIIDSKHKAQHLKIPIQSEENSSPMRSRAVPQAPTHHKHLQNIMISQ